MPFTPITSKKFKVPHEQTEPSYVLARAELLLQKEKEKR